MLSPKEGPHGSVIEVDGKNGDYDAMIKEFLRYRGIAFTLAFSGGADDKSAILDSFRESLANDERIPMEVRTELPKRADAAAHENISKLVRSILTPLQRYRIAVLTGGTKWGVPDAATRVARDLGLTTIGVYPLVAKMKKHSLSSDLLDLSVCVHPFIDESCWGDESPIYTKLLDSVIVIGGGAGTMIEVSHLLKLNERRKSNQKWILPVYGTGGTADKLSFFPGKPTTMAKCVPAMPLTTGEEIVDFLHNHNILSEDIYEPA